MDLTTGTGRWPLERFVFLHRLPMDEGLEFGLLRETSTYFTFSCFMGFPRAAALKVSRANVSWQEVAVSCGGVDDYLGKSVAEVVLG